MSRVESISKILREASEQKTRQEKIDILRRYDHIGLRNFLAIALDENIDWDLPKGCPPFTPCKHPDQEGHLYKELRRLYLFQKGGANISQKKRELLFIQLLESLTPSDADLLIAVKDRKWPYKTITKKLVEEAYGIN